MPFINVDYGDAKGEDSKGDTQREFLEENFSHAVCLAVDELSSDPDSFRTRVATLLFSSEGNDRIFAGLLLMALSPLLGDDMALALNAALREDPPDNREHLPAFGLTTRALASRALGAMRMRGAVALPRLYELLDAAEGVGDVHTSVAADSMGVCAAELADTIAQIEGGSAANRLLPLFEKILQTSQTTSRDERSLTAAVHGLGFLRRAGRPLLHWLDWMDREKHPEIRFIVGCAAIRLRDGDHDFNSRIPLPIREFHSIRDFLLSESPDSMLLADAVELSTALRNVIHLSKAEDEQIRGRIEALCEHMLPSIYVPARVAQRQLAAH